MVKYFEYKFEQIQPRKQL